MLNIVPPLMTWEEDLLVFLFSSSELLLLLLDLLRLARPLLYLQPQIQMQNFITYTRHFFFFTFLQ